MTKLRIRIIDNDLIGMYNDLLKDPEVHIRDSIAAIYQQKRLEILHDFRQQPGKSNFTGWVSKKQSNYMHMLERMGIIQFPTVRSNQLSEGWNVYWGLTSGLGWLTIVNNVDYEIYVEGIWQQPFHEATGWFFDNDLADKWTEELADSIEEKLTEEMTLSWLTDKQK